MAGLLTLVEEVVVGLVVFVVIEVEHKIVFFEASVVVVVVVDNMDVRNRRAAVAVRTGIIVDSSRLRDEHMYE